MSEDVTKDVTDAPQVKKSRFGRILFLGKKGESETDLKARFDEKYSDGSEYDFEESDKFQNGTALVRKKFKEKPKTEIKEPMICQNCGKPCVSNPAEEISPKEEIPEETNKE